MRVSKANIVAAPPKILSKKTQHNVMASDINVFNSGIDLLSISDNANFLLNAPQAEAECTVGDLQLEDGEVI